MRDGQPLDLGGPRQRAVLVALLVKAGRAVTADELADAVWEGSPPPAAGSTLRAYVSNLRKLIEPGREAGAPPKLLRTQGRSYVLELPPGSLDAERFEDLTAAGRHAVAGGDHRKAADSFGQALGLWRGAAYAELAAVEWARADATRLEESRLNCVEDLVETRLALGEHAELTGELAALTSQHPWRERLWMARMLALYRAGRQGDALAAYEEARRCLCDELGVDPSPEMRDLHGAILRQEPLGTTAVSGGRQTLTFLFTDIELSTEKLLASPDEQAYAAVLEEHRGALRGAFAAHGGRDVRTWGDAFFAAFNSAGDAVRAAVEAQLALGSPEGDGVRVRIGLHTGEVAFIADEFVGLAVHAAARVGAAAHGGQILLTQATREMIDRAVNDEVGFDDVGLHALKDLPDPIRLFQVTHPGLLRSFPAPKTLSATPHNLPSQMTSFVGREHDVAEVAELLRTSRVVTLTGVGGVGKTRLAIEVATEVLPRYPDGVTLCELAGVGDFDGILSCVLLSVGVDKSGSSMSFADSVLAALRQRRMLLVLDNCEHLLEPAAQLVEAVTRSCPNVTLLVTSREGLGADGERIRPLRSLGLPPDADDDTERVSETGAGQLFVDRARAVRPEFVLGPHNAAAVADICRRLDGIPLAIELAAGRIATMGPLEIAARLDQRFRFLRSGRRTIVERHRTLQATLDWSYGLLSPDEQLLFDRLSVFSGGFDLTAAEGVCGEDALDVGDILEGLVTKSLVNAHLTPTATRYSMLETLRQYGHAKLDNRGEVEPIREAHARYYLSFAIAAAPGLVSEDELEWTDRVEQDFDNLRAAHAWAVSTDDADLALRLVRALFWFGGSRLMASEIEDSWSLRAAELPSAQGHELYPVVVGQAAEIACAAGDTERATSLAKRALAHAVDPDDPRREHALYALMTAQMFEGEIAAAVATADEVIRLCAISGDVVRETEVRWSQALVAGYTAHEEGDERRVEHILATAEDATKRMTGLGPTLRGWIAYVRGEVILDIDPPRALSHLDEAIQILRRTNNSFVLGVALLSAVSLRGRHLDPVEALPGYLDVIECWRRLGTWTQQWTTLLNLAELFVRLELDEAAVVLVHAAETSTSATTSFGAEAQRLAAAMATSERRLDPDAFGAARERGLAISDEDAVEFACAAIRRAIDQKR